MTPGRRWDERDRQALRILYVLLASLVLGVMLTTPRAEASPATDEFAARYGPALCDVIDTYPTIPGLTGVIQAVMEQGFTPYDSGVVVGTAVYDYCPQHVDLLLEFVRVYGKKPAPVYVAGAVGGRL